MQTKRRLYFLCLTGFLVALLLSSIQSPVYGEGSAKAGSINQLDYSFDCLALLREVAASAGLKGQESSATDYTDINQNYIHCDLQLEEEIDKRTTDHYFSWYSARLIIMSSAEDPEVMSGGDWIIRTKTTFHGYPALLETTEPIEENAKAFHWYIPDHELVFYLNLYSYETVGNEHIYLTPDWMQVAETFYAVTYNRYPELKLPPPDQGESLPIETEQVVIVEENTQPEVVVVPYGGETEAPTEAEQEVVVVPYGETSPEDTFAETGSFDETWQSPQAKAVRSPLIPIAGGLIGAGLAWLLAQGSSQAANAAVPMAATVYAPPQTIPPVITQTPPVLATEPPKLVNEPPAIQTEVPQIKPVEPPPDPYKLGFTLVKDAVGTTGTLTGIYEQFLTNPNSLKTANIIKDVVKKLDQTPGVEATAEYVADVAKVKAAEKVAKIGKKLGIAGKLLDTAEALMNAEKICAKRGYRGMDAVLRTYAEVGKKGVVWLLTENPVVGLADAAVGGATSMVFGTDNKVDISVVVEKADYAWDNVTRHASNKWNRSFETAAENEKTENLKHLTERIRTQVEDGKVSKQEGSRRLQRVLDKFNQESPLL
ncbi:MAG: hypothetical protein C0410_02895 [Anaerolinea sp.]|nr:hypothetical protein [Anaerolinea sp.]